MVACSVLATGSKVDVRTDYRGDYRTPPLRIGWDPEIGGTFSLTNPSPGGEGPREYTRRWTPASCSRCGHDIKERDYERNVADSLVDGTR